jgi:hypothetical protein
VSSLKITRVVVANNVLVFGSPHIDWTTQMRELVTQLPYALKARKWRPKTRTE